MKKVSESWISSFQQGRNLVDVYENPSYSDYREIYKNSGGHYGVRCIIDGTTKKVYVWDVLSATHYDVAKRLNLLSRISSDNSILLGGAGTSSGKGVLEESDTLERIVQAIKEGGIRRQIAILDAKDILSTDWSWAYKYVDCREYLNRFRKKIKDLVEER
jgi:hypothetical protein